MKTSRINIEQLLYGLTFLLALTVRLWSLGAKPLSDGEAALALDALSVARGGQLTGGAQPAYIMLTGSLFWVFGSANFLVRLLPALAGSLLILAPFAYRRILGDPTSLVLAFGLALDPGLVALSRLAGGSMLAISFLFLTAGLALDRRWVLAGVFGGLALLSGPDIIQGLLIAALAWLAWRGFPHEARLESHEETPTALFDKKVDLIPFLAGIAITILFAGTLLFRYPQGLGAWLNTLPAYLGKWAHPSDVPVSRLLAALLIYQPLAIFFALVNTLQWGKRLAEGISNQRVVPLGTLLAVIGLLLSLVNPGREIGDLGWVLVFVWTLAAAELARSFYLPFFQRLASGGLAGMVCLLMAIFWLQVTSMSTALPGSSLDFVRPMIVIATFALAALMTWLVASAWSWELARLGLVWGVVFSLGIYLIAEVGGIIRIVPALQEIERQELWQPYPQIAQAELLGKTLNDLSVWKTGRGDAIDIRVNVDAPSLRWVLRSFKNASFTPGYQPTALPEMGSQSLPSIFITRQGVETPNLATAYRGQDFDWWQMPDWEGVLPPNFLQWLLYRKAAWQDEQIILWARGDLFPSGSLAPSTDTTSPDEEIDPLLNKQVK